MKRNARRIGRNKLQNAAAKMVETLESRVMLSGNIRVTVLHDMNGNGLRDAEDTGLGGWNVFIDVNRDGVRQTTEPQQATDSNGQTTFAGLDTNTFDVYEVPPSGWSPAPGFKT